MHMRTLCMMHNMLKGGPGERAVDYTRRKTAIR